MLEYRRVEPSRDLLPRPSRELSHPQRILRAPAEPQVHQIVCRREGVGKPPTVPVVKMEGEGAEPDILQVPGGCCGYAGSCQRSYPGTQTAP